MLSRARTYVLKPLGQADVRTVLEHALHDAERGLGAMRLQIATESLDELAAAADGDARRALNCSELSDLRAAPTACASMARRYVR